MRVAIVGAGITGMAAAHVLRNAGHDPMVFEAENTVGGGLLRTDSVGGYAFERSGHFLHTRNPELDQLIMWSGVKFSRHVRNSAVIIDGAIVPYPLQYNTWAMSSKQRAAVLEDLDRRDTAAPRQTFLELMLASWGPTLSELFFVPYNEKLWGRSLDLLPSDCAGKYMPTLSIDLIRKGAAGPITNHGYNATFECPLSGRIGDFADGLANPISDCISVGTGVNGIDLENRKCITAGGEFSYDRLISTAPLPKTIAMTGLTLGDTDTAQFSSTKVWIIRVGFVGQVLRPEHWYYVPDRSVPFFRIVLPTNIHDGLAPQGRSILSIEVTAEARQLSAKSLAKDALEYLADVGAVNWSEIEVIDSQMIDPAYVIYRAETSPPIVAMRDDLERRGVLSAGRYGEWDYFSIDQAARSGFDAARKLISRDS